MVLAIDFLLWSLFPKKNSFCELWGIFFKKKFEGLHFLLVILGVLIFPSALDEAC